MTKRVSHVLIVLEFSGAVKRAVGIKSCEGALSLLAGPSKAITAFGFKLVSAQ